MRALALFLAVGVLSATGAANAEYKSWVLAKFDDTPEGLTVDNDGNYYAALMHTGKIMKVTPDGRQELIATIPPETSAHDGDAVGVELDEEGRPLRRLQAEFADVRGERPGRPVPCRVPRRQRDRLGRVQDRVGHQEGNGACH